jgi:phage tail-like protein
MPAIDTEQKENLYSSYLQYLPALYRDDDFTGRFLHIFEDIFKSVENIADNVPWYFDPGTAPEGFLPWLSSWLGLVLDESWPEVKRRQLLRRAGELYRWRGTKRGIAEYIEIYAGVAPKITEHIRAEGMRLGGESKLGKPMQIGGKGAEFTFTVEIKLPAKSDADIEVIKNIIESEKPAHTGYFLRVT